MPPDMRGHMVTQKDTIPNILADRLKSIWTEIINEVVIIIIIIK
jgi:hypothetical protein